MIRKIPIAPDPEDFAAVDADMGHCHTTPPKSKPPTATALRKPAS